MVNQTLRNNLNRAIGGRTDRASGGRVTDVDALVNRLMARWKQVKRETNETTKPLLGMPDSAIAKALDVAQQSI